MLWNGRCDTGLLLLAVYCGFSSSLVAAEWPQLLGDARHSGNAPQCVLSEKLGLMQAIPLTDAVLASPVVSQGKVFVVDGSGVVTAIDASTLQEIWTFQTSGGNGNCNNVSAPAVIGDFLHVGTMAGYYYVLDTSSGKVVHKIDCREPIFAAPVLGRNRVYFATLGAQVHAVEPNGQPIWTWDFVKEVIKFDDDRWSGSDWLNFRGDRVTWRDHFVCSRDFCVVGNSVILPAGGRTVFLEDRGETPHLQTVVEIPSYVGNEYPATFGQSADEEGNVYVQWHRRDNAGRVEILRYEKDALQTRFVAGTETSIDQDGLLSFASVSIRDGDVYRVKPEHGEGLCRHSSRRGSRRGAMCCWFHLPSGVDKGTRRVRRFGRQAVRRLTHGRRHDLLSNGVRRSNFCTGRHRRRTHLRPLRRWLSLRLR